MSGLVEEAVFEQVFQDRAVVAVFVVRDLRVLFPKHPNAQEEGATVSRIQSDDVAPNMLIALFEDEIVDDEDQGQNHGLEEGVVVGFLDFLPADQEAEIDVAERGNKRQNSHMIDQFGLEFRVEQPDAETHDDGYEAGP